VAVKQVEAKAQQIAFMIAEAEAEQFYRQIAGSRINMMPPLMKERAIATTNAVFWAIWNAGKQEGKREALAELEK
jgi:hypothetical protein